jgi:hypothetical protein
MAQFIAQTPNADERPLNHGKQSRYKSNVSRLGYAMLSGLSEISLCTYRRTVRGPTQHGFGTRMEKRGLMA